MGRNAPEKIAAIPHETTQVTTPDQVSSYAGAVSGALSEEGSDYGAPEMEEDIDSSRMSSGQQCVDFIKF